MGKPTTLQAGQLCKVHNRWPGVVKGSASTERGLPGYVVQYTKHGSNIVQIVPASAVKERTK